MFPFFYLLAPDPAIEIEFSRFRVWGHESKLRIFYLLTAITGVTFLTLLWFLISRLPAISILEIFSLAITLPIEAAMIYKIYDLKGDIEIEKALQNKLHQTEKRKPQ